MKKLFTLFATTSFFAISISIIDHFIWNNEFNWINVTIGFITGGALI